jgi:hypothetical protein
MLSQIVELNRNRAVDFHNFVSGRQFAVCLADSVRS